MSDPSVNSDSPAQKYKTVARAVAADDVPACRELLSIFEADGKKLSSEEVEALAFRWLTLRTKNERSLDMINFFHELGFDFTQFVPGAGRRSVMGNHIPFLLMETKGEGDLLKRALEIGAIPLDSRDTAGDSLLVDALDMGLFDMANYLRLAGVDVDATNIAGQSALHIFAGKLDFRAVEWLLLNGANPDLEDIQFSRPSQVVPEEAEGYDAEAMYDTLEDYVVDFKIGLPFIASPAFASEVAREVQAEMDAKAEAEAKAEAAAASRAARKTPSP